MIFALCAALISLLCSQQADAYTGCPGNGPTNSHVAVEYIFHEGSGNTAFNTGTDGDAGNATLINGAAFTADVPPSNAGCGWSIALPSSGSGSTTPAVETSGSYDPLAGATQFTIMAWVKRESLSVSNNTAARIVSDIDSLGSTANGFELRFSGQSGLLTFTINGKDHQTSTGGIAPNSNAWHHVAVVYDGSRPATNALTRHVHFYVDGVQRGLGVSNATLNVSVSANTNRLTIGNSSVGRGVNNLLVGKIDDVRILRGFAPAAVGDGKTNAVILCYMNSKDDFEPPTIACPSDVTVSTDAGYSYATNVQLGQPQVSDDCGVASVTNDAPAQYPVGLVGVTWAVSDIAGNRSTCVQTVTVEWNRTADTDGDGLKDWDEVNVYGTNPLTPDTDGDDMNDSWEIQHGLNPRDASDGKADGDGDGYSNFEEWWMGTNPTNAAEPITIYVDGSYNGGVEDGSTDRPYKRIQSAVDAVPANAVRAIRVRPGVYYERVYATGKAHIHIFSDSGPLDTVIDGEQVDSSVVRMYDFSRASLVGFTVRNARTDWMGGGLRLDATNGVVLVADNVITSNVTTNKDPSGGGGGIYVRTADGSMLLNNLIRNNSARRGGGVLFARGNVVFKYNTVIENEATAGLGGGLSAIQRVQPDVQHNVIWGNSATQVHQLTISNNFVQGGAAGFNNQEATGHPPVHPLRTETRNRMRTAQGSRRPPSGGPQVCGRIFAGPQFGVSFGQVQAGKMYAYRATGCMTFDPRIERMGCRWIPPAPYLFCPVPFFSDPDGAVYRSAGCQSFCSYFIALLGAVCNWNIGWSLVGSIGGGPCFQLGTDGTFCAPASGELKLYWNSTGCEPDTEGFWDVCIEELPGEPEQAGGLIISVIAPNPNWPTTSISTAPAGMFQRLGYPTSTNVEQVLMDVASHYAPELFQGMLVTWWQDLVRRNLDPVIIPAPAGRLDNATRADKKWIALAALARSTNPIPSGGRLTLVDLEIVRAAREWRLINEFVVGCTDTDRNRFRSNVACIRANAEVGVTPYKILQPAIVRVRTNIGTFTINLNSVPLMGNMVGERVWIGPPFPGPKNGLKTGGRRGDNYITHRTEGRVPLILQPLEAALAPVPYSQIPPFSSEVKFRVWRSGLRMEDQVSLQEVNESCIWPTARVYDYNVRRKHYDSRGTKDLRNQSATPFDCFVCNGIPCPE